ncbi:MAG: hypothetical protein M1814_004033 [Vezdaea aestivalis]|nr:MAG: hypothetical protein M1814_004033 [Vezdaea aestivalis]
MGDPVSLAAGCLAFSLASLSATTLVFRWLDGIKNVDEEMECFRAEMQGLSSVLGAVRDSFREIDNGAIEEHGSQAVYHFQTVQQVMSDCDQCLKRLNECLPDSKSTNQTGKVVSRRISISNLKKKVLLDFKSDRIMMLRRQLQSHRDVLSIHISLINLGGRQGMSPSVETTAIYVLVQDMKSTRKKLDSRIEKTRIGSIGGVQDQTEDAYMNMDNCLQSVKSIISDGTSTAIDNTVQGSFAGFYLSQEKKRDVEKWLAPNSAPQRTESTRRPLSVAVSDFEDSRWRDDGRDLNSADDSISRYQPSESDHFRRLGTLRGASPMSRISEEASTVFQRSSLGTQRNNLNPYRNALLAEAHPAADLRKSRSERAPRVSRSPTRGRPLVDIPLRAASYSTGPAHSSDHSVFDPHVGHDARPIAPIPQRAFSFISRVPEQGTEWEYEPSADLHNTPARREHIASRSTSTADDLLHPRSAVPAHQRQISLPAVSNESATTSPLSKRIPSFKRQSSKSGASTDANIDLSQSSQASSLSRPMDLPTFDLSNTTELSLRVYDQHKKSGSIQLVPSGKAGAKRTERVLIRLMEQFGSSAPQHVQIEINELLVVMYKKQREFESAERVLNKLERMVTPDQQVKIRLEKMYVKAELARLRKQDKEAEGLARQVASYELSTKRGDSTSEPFKNSVMLLITLAEQQSEVAEVRAYEGLLPNGYRQLQRFRDFCDQLDDMLDENKPRKLDKLLSNNLTSFGFKPSGTKLRSIQMQISNATSVAVGGKGVASQHLPIFSLSHLLAENNHAPELEVLYRCVDASQQPSKRIDQDKWSLYLEDSSPLIVACRKGALEAAKVLIDKNIDINAQNSDGETALHVSIRIGHTLIAAYLIDHSASLNIQDNLGETPYELGRKCQDPIILRKMISTGSHHTIATPEFAAELPADLPSTIVLAERTEPSLELPLDNKQTPATSPDLSSPSLPYFPEEHHVEDTRSFLAPSFEQPIFPSTNPFSQSISPAPTPPPAAHTPWNADCYSTFEQPRKAPAPPSMNPFVN